MHSVGITVRRRDRPFIRGFAVCFAVLAAEWAVQNDVHPDDAPYILNSNEVSPQLDLNSSRMKPLADRGAWRIMAENVVRVDG